ncbi:glyoxalase [Aliifodinibius salipaludis]|uniref:Glyoxalase n=1 Tax=Fodinibius salipaludis TaxID=2032627 RepID=A0A2A2G9I3_9BACT|nr:VOC family protein [Aliifodinibius salipaludis]PAU93968.1 glyoxalase [Aliifodinibius salipaludis]
MKKVIGIGGIFFKSENPTKLAAWYKKHLGLPIDESYGGYTFDWKDDDLRALIKVLKSEGIQISGKIEDTEFGLFGWIIDPEGNKVELWEPVKE